MPDTLRAAAAALALALAPLVPLAAPMAGVALEVELGAAADGVRELDVTLFPPRVLVPGDVESRVLRVHNAGPTDAVLTAKLREKSHTDAAGDGLYDLLTVNGRSFAQLADAASYTVLHEVRLPQGEFADLPFELALPVTTAGNAAQTGQRAVEFSVQLTLVADLAAGNGGDTGDGEGAGAGGGGGAGEDGVWAATGGQLVAGRPLWVWGATVLMVAMAAEMLRRAFRGAPAAARTTRRRSCRRRAPHPTP